MAQVYNGTYQGHEVAVKVEIRVFFLGGGPVGESVKICHFFA